MTSQRADVHIFVIHPVCLFKSRASQKMSGMDFLMSVKFTDGMKTHVERKWWENEFSKIWPPFLFLFFFNSTQNLIITHTGHFMCLTANALSCNAVVQSPFYRLSYYSSCHHFPRSTWQSSCEWRAWATCPARSPATFRAPSAIKFTPRVECCSLPAESWWWTSSPTASQLISYQVTRLSGCHSFSQHCVCVFSPHVVI